MCQSNSSVQNATLDKDSDTFYTDHWIRKSLIAHYIQLDSYRGSSENSTVVAVIFSIKLHTHTLSLSLSLTIPHPSLSTIQLTKQPYVNLNFNRKLLLLINYLSQIMNYH